MTRRRSTPAVAATTVAVITLTACGASPAVQQSVAQRQAAGGSALAGGAHGMCGANAAASALRHLGV